MTHGLSLERAEVAKLVRRGEITKVFNPGAKRESVKEKLVEGLLVTITTITVMETFPQVRGRTTEACDTSATLPRDGTGGPLLLVQEAPRRSDGEREKHHPSNLDVSV
jgi:hypothetical protein